MNARRGVGRHRGKHNGVSGEKLFVGLDVMADPNDSVRLNGRYDLRSG